MRNQLGGSERTQYADRPPAGRRQWLLGRIAAKDAVRRHLWQTVGGEIYPAEIEIRNQPSGMPCAVGIHGRELPALTVSIAHRGETGVAIVRDGPCGIDIEEIAERPASTYTVACGPAELELMGEQSPVRFARFWTAKEAVAKLLGTGLRGAPQRFEVIELLDDRLVVQVDGQRSTTYDSKGCRGRTAGSTSWRGQVRTDDCRDRGSRRSDRAGGPHRDAARLLLEDVRRSRTSRSPWRRRSTDDLELESIDLVTLAGLLRSTTATRINFAKFLAGKELDEIIALDRR